MFKNSLVCNTDVERAHVHYLGVRLVLIGLCSRFTHTASRQRLCGFCLGFISLLLLFPSLLHCLLIFIQLGNILCLLIMLQILRIVQI